MGFQPLPSAAATSPAPGKSQFVEAAHVLGAAQLLPRTAQYLCVGEKYPRKKKVGGRYLSWLT